MIDWRKKFDPKGSSEVCKMWGCLKCKYENCIFICRRLSYKSIPLVCCLTLSRCSPWHVLQFKVNYTSVHNIWNVSAPKLLSVHLESVKYIYSRKNAYALKTPRVVYLYSHNPQSLPKHLHRWSHQWLRDMKSLSLEKPNPIKRLLTWWPWPLTYDPDLRTWPRYPSIRPACWNSCNNLLRRIERHWLTKSWHLSKLQSYA